MVSRMVRQMSPVTMTPDASVRPPVATPVRVRHAVVWYRSLGQHVHGIIHRPGWDPGASHLMAGVTSPAPLQITVHVDALTGLARAEGR